MLAPQPDSPESSPRRIRPSTRSRVCDLLIALGSAFGLVVLLFLYDRFRGPRVIPINPNYGHSVGEECHSVPVRPLETRPCGCKEQIAAQELRVIAAQELSVALIVINFKLPDTNDETTATSTAIT